MAAELEERSILELPELLDGIDPFQRIVFDRIYKIRADEVPMFYQSPDVLEEMAQKFKTSSDSLERRRSLRVRNIVLDEETLFNPLRASRPLQSSVGNQVKELELKNASVNCDFCHPEDSTPFDPFGRVESDRSYTAANAASYDAMHSLVIPRNVHHPLDVDQETFSDMIKTANSWFQKAHEYNPNAKFPVMGMNVLPRAGASIFHPHLQVLLAQGEPYQKIEDVRRRTSDYQQNHTWPYLNDLAFSMRDLGLVHDINSAHVVFNLAPKKEKEVIVYANDGNPSPNGDLSQALYSVIQWWREGLGATSFNMFIYMPPIGEDLSQGPWRNFFPFARILDRGVEGTQTSDMAVSELYGAAVVASDPFKLAASYNSFHKNRSLLAA